MPGFYLKLPWQEARFKEIVRFPYLVGRSVKGDLEVPDPCVSRRHFQLKQSGSAIVLQDLKSMGGTQINGTRVNEAPLAEGDIIHVGECILQFTHDNRPPALTPLLQQEWVLCLEERGTIDFFYSLSGERTYLINVADRMDVRTGLGNDSQDLHQIQVHTDGQIECRRLPFHVLMSRALEQPQMLTPGTAVQFGTVSVHILAMTPFPFGPTSVQRLIRRQKFLEMLEGKSLERFEQMLRETPPGPERSRVLKNTLSTWLSSLFAKGKKPGPEPGSAVEDGRTRLGLVPPVLDPTSGTWQTFLQAMMDRGEQASVSGLLAFHLPSPAERLDALRQSRRFLHRILPQIEEELRRLEARRPV